MHYDKMTHYQVHRYLMMTLISPLLNPQQISQRPSHVAVVSTRSEASLLIFPLVSQIIITFNTSRKTNTTQNFIDNAVTVLGFDKIKHSDQQEIASL